MKPRIHAWGWVVLCLLGTLLVLRFMLSFFLLREVNRRLSSLPDYEAQLEGLSLSLVRGSFTLKNLEFKHKAGDMALTIPESRFQIDWLALFRRMVIADITIESPRLRILANKPLSAMLKTSQKTKEAKERIEEKTGQSIADLLAGLIPFKVNRLSLHSGSIRFRQSGENLEQDTERDKDKPVDAEADNEKEPGLEARVTDLEVTVTNLTNTRILSRDPLAHGNVTAKIMDVTPVSLSVQINPIATTPQFDLGIDVKELPLKDLNAVLDWQWGIRVSSGTFTRFSESAAANGAFKGYIRPLLHDLKVSHKADRGPMQTIKEIAVKVVAAVLKNRETRNVGTQIPFEGKFENPRVGIWEAIAEVLKNAFIEALRADFDPTFKFKKP